MVASILGRTAGDSSLTGSSLASGVSVSDGEAVDTTAVPPVTSSFSFWFSSLSKQESENDNISEQSPVFS